MARCCWAFGNVPSLIGVARRSPPTLSTSMQRALSGKVLEGLTQKAQVEVALVAARLALPFWRRAFPEKELQAPMVSALHVVEVFCASGQLAAGAKAIAEAAYQAVSSCDLPSGDVQRSSGFSVAHLAMVPWLLSVGSEPKARHNLMVAINYSESIHGWAGRLPELEGSLARRAHELRGA